MFPITSVKLIPERKAMEGNLEMLLHTLKQGIGHDRHHTAYQHVKLMYEKWSTRELAK
jgi:hypothetical protein